MCTPNCTIVPVENWHFLCIYVCTDSWHCISPDNIILIQPHIHPSTLLSCLSYLNSKHYIHTNRYIHFLYASHSIAVHCAILPSIESMHTHILNLGTRHSPQLHTMIHAVHMDTEWYRDTMQFRRSMIPTMQITWLRGCTLITATLTWLLPRRSLLIRPPNWNQVTGSVLRKAGEPLNTLGYQVWVQNIPKRLRSMPCFQRQSVEIPVSKSCSSFLLGFVLQRFLVNKQAPRKCTRRRSFPPEPSRWELAQIDELDLPVKNCCDFQKKKSTYQIGVVQ